MIFVTIGTDEHPFPRLLREVENLVKKEVIKEEVVIQSGHTEFSSGVIKKVYSILPFDKFVEYIKNARIVITHGGPGSIMLALSSGKVPIVVPRRKEFGEHVDDHQIKFARFLEEKQKIILVYEVRNLFPAIKSYDSKAREYKKNSFIFQNKTRKFALSLDKICREVFYE